MTRKKRLAPALAAIDYRSIGGPLRLFLTGGCWNPQLWRFDGRKADTMGELRTIAAVYGYQVKKAGYGTYYLSGERA